MSKGFSFVLVCIVMVVMLVFGLISDSVSGADLRMSQKAVQNQQIYYGLDSSGEHILFDCATAVSSAQSSAQLFISEQQYNTALPKDFYSFLLPLVNEYKKNSSEAEKTQLQNGVFFYYLSEQLAQLKNSDGITYNVDLAALNALLAGNGKQNAAIVTLQKTINSSIDPKYSLNISLQCNFPAQTAVPVFKVMEWTSFVNGINISDDQKVNVWNGQ